MGVELNTNVPKTQYQGVDTEQLTKLAGDSTKAREIISKAVEILAGANLNVKQSDNATATGGAERKTTGATNVPALDNPADIKQIEANLAKLIAYLQLDNEERQTQMAKDRIDLQKSTLDVEHDNRMKEIDKSIQKMKDAEKASLASRIFGWIGAVLAVAAAVALTIVTGGMAAGFAIAGAVLAVTSLVLNETGAMDAMVEKLAEALKDSGMTSSNAKLAASLIINLSIAALSLGCSIGGMVSGVAAAGSAMANASKTAVDIAKTVQNIVTIANTGVAVGSLAAGGASTYYTHRSENAKADVTELEKFMTQLRQRLDESEEELEQLLQQIQAGIGKVAELLASATDTSNEIAHNLGQMA